MTPRNLDQAYQEDRVEWGRGGLSKDCLLYRYVLGMGSQPDLSEGTSVLVGCVQPDLSEGTNVLVGCVQHGAWAKASLQRKSVPWGCMRPLQATGPTATVV